MHKIRCMHIYISVPRKKKKKNSYASTVCNKGKPNVIFPEGKTGVTTIYLRTGLGHVLLSVISALPDNSSPQSLT